MASGLRATEAVETQDNLSLIFNSAVGFPSLPYSYKLGCDKGMTSSFLSDISGPGWQYTENQEAPSMNDIKGGQRSWGATSSWDLTDRKGLVNYGRLHQASSIRRHMQGPPRARCVTE